MRSRAVAAETPRASRLDLDPSCPRPGRPTERHTQKKPRVPSRASRVASPPTTARPSSLSPPFPSSRVIFIIEIAASAEKKRPIHHPIARATRTHRSCCQTPTHEYVVPRSIPIAGPSALLMMTRDARACRRVVKCRRGRRGRGRFASKRSFSKVGAGVCVCVMSHNSSMGRVPARHGRAVVRLVRFMI